ncbi:coproporphyrinogen dehydrogenase HemZ [Fodinisporobacter ferrooxydans]|uniref:Coproporphyrinogen dehydrogenase HemZ n=1 Tax=Fodinisporobacter ferrooxydans TaxID=2901836 RepID=A0ABY4CHD7_9BACL|nr:coproporphyrinogen dehydrogenase HemZ [Alicyclobacillaceae bacterium MYW30-H2]
MKVQIRTDGCPYYDEMERFLSLFLPDAEIIFQDHSAGTGESEPFDCIIQLQASQRVDAIHVQGELRISEQVFQAQHAKAIPAHVEHAAWRKRGKQAVLHVLHQLLEKLTGEHQPWGILTGVRPLKLVHQMVEQGLPAERIRQQLLQEYLLSPERAELLLEIADIQLQVVPDLYRLDREVSIYIGIPFCPTHCAYCTFPAYSMTEKATYVDDFLQAMDLELVHLGRLLRDYRIPVTSVYVGGGTPTSLKAPEMERMMESIYREIPNPGQWREFTVEAGRPDTITPDRVAVMRKYGVNRVSVNPQTYKASTLKEIGRGHSPAIIDKRFYLVREAGFENINMDMILGLPGETLDDVRYTMERIEALAPESVTVHTMSFKRSAVVKNERERFAIPHSQLVRRMMAEASQWAKGLGYHPYYVYRQKDILGNMENVGFAKPGKDSIYNICIMEERQTIVGIGGGAVSKCIGAGGRHMGRFANPREPKAYVETVDDFLARKDQKLRPVFESIENANVTHMQS